jgi:hypothetical protein
MIARALSPTGRLSDGVAFGGTALLFLVAPFERLQPLVSLPGQNITTVELSIGVAMAAWLGALVASGDRPRWRTPLTWPWVTWLAICALAALAAPVFHASSIKIAGRLGVGLAAVLLAANGITTARRLAVVIQLAVASAAVVATLAVLEYAGVPAVLSWLKAFHEGRWVVGGQVRASGPLQYPTITSMYLEIAFALGVGAFLAACDRRAALAAGVLFLALLLIAEGIVVTFTRAGLVTMAASLMLAGRDRFLRRRFDVALGSLGAIAALVVALVISSASLESLRLRLTTHGQENWYRAGFLVTPTLSFAPRSLNVIEATVTNNGRVTWRPDADPPFHVSYHWLDEDTNRVVRYDGLRTPLPRPVTPGDSLRIGILVRAPDEAGRYRVGWDVVQEGRLWFSTEPGSRLAWSTVEVSGPAAAADGPPPSSQPSPASLPEQAVRLSRPVLWRAALAMFSAHPILGVGPDNYRLSYGPYAHVANADPRVHSNNMYLEVLTGTGLVGTSAFFWLCWRAQRAVGEACRRSSPMTASLYSGVAAAGFAIAVHGLVDSFLTFTPTYLVMSLTLGLVVTPAAGTPPPANAHRV